MSDGGAPRIAQVVRQRTGYAARDLFRRTEPVAVTRGDEAVEAGDIVTIRAGSRPEARIEKVCARSGTALAAMYLLAAKHGLDPLFGEEVDHEVEALRRRPGIDDPSLTDLEHLPFVSVDGPGTRDLDQALHLARDGRGFRVDYALADAAYYVPVGGALFAEALCRGASYYLPGLSIPMLPRTLSEGLVSLNAGVARRALVFRIHVRADGAVFRTEIVRARVRSRAALTFDEVDAFLAARPAPTVPPEAHRSLKLLRDVGMLRLHEAERRDVVRYQRHEGELGLDESGTHFEIVGGPRGESESYNEQLSLLCNTEGARLLLAGDRDDDGVQPIYRVHPRPDAQRMEELEALLAALAERRGLDPRRWTWRKDGGRSLAEFLASLPTTGDEARITRAVHRQAVLCNMRSTYSEEPGRHHGIGAEVYARFSSPMRELVGVFVHKELLEKLGLAPASSIREDEALRERVVERAGLARQMQKRLTKEATLIALDRLFAGDLAVPREERPARSGTVMGLDRGKVHVLLDHPGIEVKVYLATMQRSRRAKLSLSPDQIELTRADGSILCRLGDEVGVQVLGRDRQGRWKLTLLPPAGQAAHRRAGERGAGVS